MTELCRNFENFAESKRFDFKFDGCSKRGIFKQKYGRRKNMTKHNLIVMDYLTD